MRAIIGLSPEDQDKAVGAAADAEQQYKQAGNAAADQAEAGVDKATQQVCTVAACLLLLLDCHFEILLWQLEFVAYLRDPLA